ncbi:metal-dependent hydrolase [Streptomyces sp. NPDC002514]|uniref:2Fe-2S iron-sulfur cluster-binding protein n=1 Tax=Streptomyces sp. NPDC001270 TaxID=3364554 RepID=UPI00369F66C8
MSNKQARPVESERIPLKPRKVSFSREDTPLHWVPDDPFTTHTLNVLHLLLPAGERRFVPRAPSDGGHAFEVELRRSGRTVTVPAGTSVLAAVRAELPDTPYSCMQGFCGTRQQRVLAGEVDHRDEAGDTSRALDAAGDGAERPGTTRICVSRALGDRLVLDM